MFERLFGKLLNRLLSKYFVYDQETDQRNSTQLSVWSGYISFENLEIRKDVVNETLQNSGIEMVSGSIASLEITIPWAKLGVPFNDDSDAVAVVVLDGVNILLRTNYDYNDEAIRKDVISSRRKALTNSEASQQRKETQSYLFPYLLQQRIKAGILRDIMEKLHLHLRDVHIRIEGINFDQSNHFAVGITLESLHLEAEDEHYSDEDHNSNYICKHIQLNHFAAYWTAISDNEKLAPEMSILHRKGWSNTKIARALNKCIARRGGALTLPSRVVANDYAPKHTYILRPLDASCHAALSKSTGNLRERPDVVCSVMIDDMSTHVRDFQIAGILGLTSAMKEYYFFKKYRAYRPPESPITSPRSWWCYAAKVVCMELRESRMRWSWSRFHQRYALRRRYCNLYERHCRYPSTWTIPRNSSSGALESLKVVTDFNPNEDLSVHFGEIEIPDEGAGPSPSKVETDSSPSITPISSNLQSIGTLSQEELIELVEIEDGIRGDLSVRDIILYRAIVNARLAGMIGAVEKAKTKSLFQSWVRSAVKEDVESEREYVRLMEYLDKASESNEVSAEQKSCVAISIRFQLDSACLSLYAALASTSDQKQEYRRLHERFMDISFKTFSSELKVMGNFQSFQSTFSLHDFSTIELRANKNEYSVISRFDKCEVESNEDFVSLGSPLAYIEIKIDPLNQNDYDIGIHGFFDCVQIVISPENEWIRRINTLMPSKFENRTSEYWKVVAFSQLRSFASDRAGWLGRRARALSKHKNLDLDVRVNCPVVRVDGEGDSNIYLDFGKAHFVTESLAGSSLGNLGNAMKMRKGTPLGSVIQSEPAPSVRYRSRSDKFDKSFRDIDSRENSDDSHTIFSFAATPHLAVDHFFASGASSVAGSETRRSNWKSATSLAMGEGIDFAQASFPSLYDKFQLNLHHAKIYMFDPASQLEQCLLSNLDMLVSVHLSVIPSDLSHCRLKVRVAVNDIVLSITQSNILEIGSIVEAFNQPVGMSRNEIPANSLTPQFREVSLGLHDELMNELNVNTLEKYNCISETNSDVDENEFLDVFEDDGETSWYEEKISADIDQVLHVDDFSRKSYPQKRRARSISDVSSISDGSKRRSQKRAGALYLSAENLARLEESRGEEDDQSVLESEDESFHSALSFGGRIELSNRLLANILEAEQEIILLEEKIAHLSNWDAFSMNTTHPKLAKSKSQERRTLNIALDRAKAELRALKASLSDLETTAETPTTEDLPSEELHETNIRKRVGQYEDIATIRAKSILRFRRQRTSVMENIDEGEMVVIPPSNYEIGHFVFTVTSVILQLQGEEVGTSHVVDFSQIACAISHRARETKLLTAIDSVRVVCIDSIMEKEIFRGGGPSKIGLLSRTVSHEINEFLNAQIQFDRRDFLPSKSKLLLGIIELGSDASLLQAMNEVSYIFRQKSANEKTNPEHRHKANALFEIMKKLIDFTVGFNDRIHQHYMWQIQCLSLRVCVWNENKSLLYVLVLSELGFRANLELSHFSARLQLDTLLSNIQIYEGLDDSGSPQHEIFRRKNSCGQLLKSRLRIHCTKRSFLDGWAFGHGRNVKVDDETEKTSQLLALDSHCGIRIQSIQIIPYKEFLLRVFNSPKSSPKMLKESRVPFVFPKGIVVRWRMDLALQKVSIILPGERVDFRSDVIKTRDGRLQTMFSIRLCIEHRCSNQSNFPIARMLMHDFSIHRLSDDWPILDKWTFALAGAIDHHLFKFDSKSLLEVMDVPGDSYWFESAVMLTDYLSLENASRILGESNEGCNLSIIFTSSNLNINLSSAILIAVLKEVAEIKAALPNQRRKDNIHQLDYSMAHFSSNFHFPLIEVKLFKDSVNECTSGILFSKPVISILVVGWRSEASIRGSDLMVSTTISNFIVHDLSIDQSVRAVGLNQARSISDSDSFLFLQVILRKLKPLPILDVRLRWGEVQLILLPSLVENTLSFLTDIWKRYLPDAPQRSALRKETNVFFANALINLSFETAEFECILSTRNIMDHVREASLDAINVVTLRWTSTLEGFIICLRSPEPSAEDIAFALNRHLHSKSHELRKIIEALSRFSENQLLTMAFITSQDKDPSTATDTDRVLLSSHLSLRVSEFQVLRTCVERKKAHFSPIGSLDKSAIFAVVPPKAGEQRITNPINFSLAYRFYGTSVNTLQCADPLSEMEVAQAFEMKADMVDVLVYILSSTGGMSDAYKTTLAPIFHALKDAHRQYQRKNTGDGKLGKIVKDLLKRATTVGSAKVKEFQVTLVPGGATQLTESPIIQFVAKSTKIGFASIDIPVHAEPPTNARTSALLAISGALRGDNNESEVKSSEKSVESHPTIAGWIQFDVSAQYHNRRLVAWEPLIEQWTAGAKVGIDLVKVFSVSPVQRCHTNFATPKRGRSSSMVKFVPDAGERLRDIGRFITSPFANKQSERGSEMVQCASDMPFLLMANLSNPFILMALDLEQRQEWNIQQESSSKSVMQLPGSKRLEWIRQFGHPNRTGGVQGIRQSDSAIQCYFKDMRTLNINFTGALIENVATYLTGASRINPIIPHWIRNESGLTIHFREILDPERQRKGEESKSTILTSGREIPLSLQRAVSQSCDPHRAQITLELGSFDETVDRINHSSYKVSKGSRSTTFFYKASGKIHVDTVGVNEVFFHENTELMSVKAPERGTAVGKVIVRISLEGGIKLVTVESPMLLSNVTGHDLRCEIRDKDGIAQFWSSVIPNESDDLEVVPQIRRVIPVPADLIPLLDKADVILSLDASSQLPMSQFQSTSTSHFFPVDPPKPFSESSLSKGVVSERELSLTMRRGPDEGTREAFKRIFISACGLRIGSFDTTSNSKYRANGRRRDTSILPEQRMLKLRAPLVIANQLPLSMHVHVRRKVMSAFSTYVSSSNLTYLAKSNSSDLLGKLKSSSSNVGGNDSLDVSETDVEEKWMDLGIINSGKYVQWTGAETSQEVELKIRLIDSGSKRCERFPSWSTVSSIAPDIPGQRKASQNEMLSSVLIHDEFGTPLRLSVHTETKIRLDKNEDIAAEDIKALSASLGLARRVVSVAVPYWVVDSSGLDLTFMANEYDSWKRVAGQRAWLGRPTNSNLDLSRSLGLAEVTSSDERKSEKSGIHFEILMIGDKRASALKMRQNELFDLRQGQSKRFAKESSWCKPISLMTAENEFTEVTVVTKTASLALRTEIVKAPSKCGGNIGTKIIHIFNRYKIINELGRDIELIAGGSKSPIKIEASGFPIPFHFDDSKCIRFRPKEFGWLWSGKIRNVKNRREMTIRLVHKLRGQIVIANIKFLSSSKTPSTILIFREATQPPFRLENHSQHAFRYNQVTSLFKIRKSSVSLSNTLLPYQNVDFAWDEPDVSHRSISIELLETGFRGTTESRLIGEFALEKIIPGTKCDGNHHVTVMIFADGPTRVLRLVDSRNPATSPIISPPKSVPDGLSSNDTTNSFPSTLEIRLTHGVGISVIDWSPKELLYICLDDLVVERNVNMAEESVSFKIGHLSVDNQLWVTPYPVLLKVGRKHERRRRNQAFELKWTRLLTKPGGLILLKNVEVSVDPVVIRVDGALVKHLLSMFLHPVTDRRWSPPLVDDWLEREIERVLRFGLTPELRGSRPSSNAPRKLVHGQRMEGQRAFTALEPKASGIFLAGTRDKMSTALLQHQEEQKFYVNALKISRLKTEISWTRALPTSVIGLPSFLRPLNFESLPIIFTSFTRHHEYGASREIIEVVKHHYVSVWRVFDNLFGLISKPDWVVYTTKEAFASCLDTTSQYCSIVEEKLLDIMPKYANDRPSLLEEGSKFDTLKVQKRSIVETSFEKLASGLGSLSRSLSAVAASMRYRETDGNAASRTRYPRLFAQVDGKELLVEYVEGENAGKALLSRVRSGQHLSEGYVFHAENVHLRSHEIDLNGNMPSVPLIIMVTSERLMLLNGERKANFCHVVWETLIDAILDIDIDDADVTFLRLVKVWHLIHTGFLKAKSDILDSDLGLNMLTCRSLFIPQEVAKTLRKKIVSLPRQYEILTTQA